MSAHPSFPGEDPQHELELDEVIQRANRLLDNSGGSVPQSLKFEWHDIEFSATRRTADERTHISIEASLGYVPYTAQNRRQRAEALATLSTAGSAQGAVFALQPDGEVLFSSETAADDIASLPDLLQHITESVLEKSRHLKSLSRILIR